MSVAAGDPDAARYMERTGRHSEGRVLTNAHDVALGFQPRRWVTKRTEIRHRGERRYDLYHVRVGEGGWISVALHPGIEHVVLIVRQQRRIFGFRRETLADRLMRAHPRLNVHIVAV